MFVLNYAHTLPDRFEMARKEMKGRVIVSSDKMPCLPSSSNPPFNVRPSEYKAYNKATMSEALSAVVTEGMQVQVS